LEPRPVSLAENSVPEGIIALETEDRTTYGLRDQESEVRDQISQRQLQRV
jgi:hypothetical protein